MCHVHRTAGSHGSVSAPHHQPVYTVSMDGTRRCPGCQLRSLSHVPASRPRRLREVLSRTFCDLDWTTQLAAGSHARLTARKVKERRVTPGLHPSCRVPVAAALHRRMRNTTGWPASSHFRALKPEPPPGDRTHARSLHCSCVPRLPAGAGGEAADCRASGGHSENWNLCERHRQGAPVTHCAGALSSFFTSRRYKGSSGGGGSP